MIKTMASRNLLIGGMFLFFLFTLLLSRVAGSEEKAAAGTLTMTGLRTEGVKVTTEPLQMEGLRREPVRVTPGK